MYPDPFYANYSHNQILLIPQSHTYPKRWIRLQEHQESFELYTDSQHRLTTIPKSQFHLFYLDLWGIIPSQTPSTIPSLQKIFNHPRYFIHRGNDCLTFDTQDSNIVKASTDLFYHWNNGIASEGTGTTRFIQQVLLATWASQLTNGINPQTLHIHEQRAFSISKKLDLTAPLTTKHFRQIRETIQTLHQNHIYCLDRLQIGLDFQGTPKIYDTGSFQHITNSSYEQENARSYDADAFANLTNGTLQLYPKDSYKSQLRLLRFISQAKQTTRDQYLKELHELKQNLRRELQAA